MSQIEISEKQISGRQSKKKVSKTKERNKKILKNQAQLAKHHDGECQNNAKDLKNKRKKVKRKDPSFVESSTTPAILRISCLKTKHSNRNENCKEKKIGMSPKCLREKDKTKLKSQKKINTISKLHNSSVNLANNTESTRCNSKLNSSKVGVKNQQIKTKLQNMLFHHTEEICAKNQKVLTLRESMMQRLKSARFRYLNEQMYSQTGKDAQMFFKTDPQSFKIYHEGYQHQVQKWPLNPVDNIIHDIKKMPTSFVIADLGCGDAKIAKTVSQTVHSFDLVAVNDLVTSCDMANLPLKSDSIDVAVFCLSLMGTNVRDYLNECNRILKLGGIMKIVEVESRIDSIEDFTKQVQTFGFKNTRKDFSHKLFYFLDFKKISNIQNTKRLPVISLKPCIYKKR